MKVKKVVSLFGVIGTLFYFFHVIFGSLFYEGYNPLSQAISDLTATSSPSRNIAFVFSLLYGIFTVIFAISFYIFSKKYMTKIIILGSLVFCCMNIISVAGYNIFPLSEAGFAGTL